MASGDPIPQAEHDDRAAAERGAHLRILVDGAATAGRFALLELVVARGAAPPLWWLPGSSGA